mgnify:FL=1
MEIEQLVGFVRLQRAKLAGYECLDEVLTTVMNADAKVKDLQQQQRREQVKLDEVCARHCGMDKELTAIRDKHEAELKKAQDRATLWHEAFDKDAAIKEHELSAKLKDQEDVYLTLVKQRNEVAAEIALFTSQAKAEAQHLVDLQAKVAAFKASLGA